MGGAARLAAPRKVCRSAALALAFPPPFSGSMASVDAKVGSILPSLEFRRFLKKYRAIAAAITKARSTLRATTTMTTALGLPLSFSEPDEAEPPPLSDPQQVLKDTFQLSVDVAKVSLFGIKDPAGSADP
jgi:hypothetical protein